MKKYAKSIVVLSLIFTFIVLSFPVLILAIPKDPESGLSYQIVGNEAVIVGFDNSVGGNVIIPSEFEDYPVTQIYENAFNDAEFVSITFPDSVTCIAAQSFCSCDKLTSITIPKNVTFLGANAFSYCASVKTVIFEGNAPETVEATPFPSGTTVYFNEGATGFDTPTWNGYNTVKLHETVYGDATGDGIVNSQDLIRLKKYLANYNSVTNTSSYEISPGADVNGDGVINGLDIVRLIKYFANYDYNTNESSIVLGPQN